MALAALIDAELDGYNGCTEHDDYGSYTGFTVHGDNTAPAGFGNGLLVTVGMVVAAAFYQTIVLVVMAAAQEFGKSIPWAWRPLWCAAGVYFCFAALTLVDFFVGNCFNHKRMWTARLVAVTSFGCDGVT